MKSRTVKIEKAKIGQFHDDGQVRIYRKYPECDDIPFELKDRDSPLIDLDKVFSDLDKNDIRG